MRRWMMILLASCALTHDTNAQIGEPDEPNQIWPNIIFIMADDMGYGDLGCYGQTEIQTPNIDALADGGTVFTDVYAGAPVCAPSRAVLMTGLHTGHTTIRGNMPAVGGVRGLGGAMRLPMPLLEVTIADVLRTEGYVNAVIGKWGLGEPDTDGHPNLQGFDFFFGFLNQRRAHNHYPDYLWENDQRVDLPITIDGQDFDYSHDLFTQGALNFIRSFDSHFQRDDGPFFLYLPYCVPHDRFQIPDLGIYADRDWPNNARVYAAMITRMDRDIGAIVALLEEMEILDDTIIFICSDNGAANRYEGIFDSSGDLRGRKRDMYEGGIRTPMIVHWPGHVPAGEYNDTPWYFADVLPTLAELAGAREHVPEGLDGMSVVPTLMGEAQPELDERVMYWEFYERGFRQAARWGDWKAVRNGHNQPIELYDLSEDPGETNNLADENPEVIAFFEEVFAEQHTPSEHFPAPIDE